MTDHPLTIRDQFRKLRAAQWEADAQHRLTDPWTGANLHHFILQVITNAPLEEVVTLGRVKIIFTPAGVRREELVERIHELTRRAMEDLYREMARIHYTRGLDA